MSKKRCADTYITDQNWDREDKDDDKEEAPEPFKPASDEVLAKRTFKKAARRVNPADKEKISNPFAAFGGFGGGFGAKTPSFSSKPSFESKPAETTVTGFNINGFPSFKAPESTNKIPTNPPSFSFSSFTKPPEPSKEVKPDPAKDVAPEDTAAADDNSVDATVHAIKNDTLDASTDCVKDDEVKTKDDVANKEEDHLVKLAALNKCLLKWIEKHMEENECIDLTPVFGDYEKHLKEISV